MVVSTSVLLTTPATSSKLPPPISSKFSVTMMASTTDGTDVNDHHKVANSISYRPMSRRDVVISIAAAGNLAYSVCGTTATAMAADDEEYVKETSEVIDKVRTTIVKDKTDPDVATAVSELREASNSWVAKYRREKALLGRTSFRDMYSALNAVSGHYISFGPTAPIPAKRKARILEEVDTAEKALIRGR